MWAEVAGNDQKGQCFGGGPFLCLTSTTTSVSDRWCRAATCRWRLSRPRILSLSLSLSHTHTHNTHTHSLSLARVFVCAMHHLCLVLLFSLTLLSFFLFFFSLLVLLGLHFHRLHSDPSSHRRTKAGLTYLLPVGSNLDFRLSFFNTWVLRTLHCDLILNLLLGVATIVLVIILLLLCVIRAFPCHRSLYFL